jgi:hypothetical protein
MNLDTRARRAADGLRASTGGVDPMAQITELKHEDQARRKSSRTVGVLGALVVVAGVGWLGVSQLGGGGEGSPEPMSSPSAVVTAPAEETEAGPVVGVGLTPPLTANAPAGWVIESDGGYVRLDADGEAGGPSLLIGGPVREVWDPEGNTIIDVPAAGYVSWLLGHPSLTLVDSRSVILSDGGTVFPPAGNDGVRARQLTFRFDRDAPGADGDSGLPLGRYAGYGTRYPWDQVWPGETFTETIIDVGGETMLVKASGARTAAERAEQDAALDLVLSTMIVPD